MDQQTAPQTCPAPDLRPGHRVLAREGFVVVVTAVQRRSDGVVVALSTGLPGAGSFVRTYGDDDVVQLVGARPVPGSPRPRTAPGPVPERRHPGATWVEGRVAAVLAADPDLDDEGVAATVWEIELPVAPPLLGFVAAVRERLAASGA